MAAVMAAAVLFAGCTGKGGGGSDASQSSAEESVHRIMTCNIRITGLPADEQPGRRWEERRQSLIKTLRAHDPDIIAMQEVIYDSYDFCREQLSDYFPFGFEGPEMDPYEEGYHLIGKNVIFFRRDRYELAAAGTYWLSEDPLICGSMSWGTNRARHCNWVRLRDRRSGCEFRLLDVHLDHKVPEAKARQAELIAREAAQYGEAFPQIICGDFNSRKDDAPARTFTLSGWSDAYDILHGGREFGYTCHAFLGDERPAKPSAGRIDYIFVRGGAEALSCEVLKDRPDGIYPSDHYFMLAEVEIR